MSKPVLPAKRRRKGFESARKGYRSADARLMFFEKGLLCCKLTVASDIRKGLLHVSLGTVESWSFAALNRGLQNLGTFQKYLILLVGICYFCVLIQGLQNLGSSRKGNGFSYFSRVRKVPKVHQRFANLWTPGTIQSSAGSNFAENFGGTCRNRFCLQNGGEKALNRCERVTVVQTQD